MQISCIYVERGLSDLMLNHRRVGLACMRREGNSAFEVPSITLSSIACAIQTIGPGPISAFAADHVYLSDNSPV
jgi:hypothetical protein